MYDGIGFSTVSNDGILFSTVPMTRDVANTRKFSMYELVNTSLPNGLIAGTHGFATVAMTKGMPDSLRIRVEAYCAYSHRSSAHDETYYSENPVNWFHAILPQGEHIVGRVAPVEFDYTGRTNRLARLFVFSKGKMPLIGGVAVLLKKARRLQEPWSGEARWLDEDTESERLFRNEPVAATKDAPSWRKKFGDSEGLNYARGFARLLAKNVNGGGKPIYFKTSAAHDVSGGELLSLFADLINLLPTSVRTSVAFSTYSAALPQGAVCHLRGVYDRDRAFDMAKVTQPWVDCEASTVHNASMLPEEEIESPKPMSQSGGGKVITTESRSRQTQSRRVQHLPAVRKKHDPLIWIFAAIAGVIVVGFVAFMLMMIVSTKKPQPPTQDDNNGNTIWSLAEDDATTSQKSNDTIIVTNLFQEYYNAAESELRKEKWDVGIVEKHLKKLSETNPIGEIPSGYHLLIKDLQLFIEQEEELKRLSDRCKKELDKFNPYESTDKLQLRLNNLEKLKSNIDKLWKQLKHGLKFDDDLYKKICDRITEYKQKINEVENRKETQRELSLFIKATNVVVGMPPKPKETTYEKAKDNIKLFKVYYYRNGYTSLTNAMAWFVPRKNPSDKKRIIDWGIEGEGWAISSESQHPIFTSRLILWLLDDTVYFDWSHCRDRNKGGKVWFASGETYDLKHDCFGDCDDVYEKWEEKCSPVRYLVKWDVSTKTGEEEVSSDPILRSEFSIQQAISHVKKNEVNKKEREVKNCRDAVADIKKKIAEVNTNLNTIVDKIETYQNLTNKIANAESAIDKIKKQLRENSFDLDSGKKQKKKLSKSDRDKLESERDKNSEEKKKLNEDANKISIEILEGRKKQLNNKLSRLNKDKEDADERLKKAENDLDNAQNNPNFKAELREKRFRVEVEGGNQ